MSIARPTPNRYSTGCLYVPVLSSFETMTSEKQNCQGPSSVFQLPSFARVQFWSQPAAGTSYLLSITRQTSEGSTFRCHVQPSFSGNSNRSWVAVCQTTSIMVPTHGANATEVLKLCLSAMDPHPTLQLLLI